MLTTTDHASPGPATARLLHLGAAATACALLAALWMWPVSRAPHRLIGDVGDPLHVAWILAWDAHQLLRDPLALYESNAFHPWPGSLAFSEHMLPEALLAAPFYWATGNAVLAHNACVFLGLVLSALAMRALVLALTRSAPAALLAGVAYAFNGFTLGESVRLHVIHLQWWPLALLFIVRFVESHRAAHAALALGLLAVQGLSCTYYLVCSLMLGPVWLLLAYLNARRWPTRAEMARLAAVGLGVALPCAVFLRPYVARLGTGFESSPTPGVDFLSFLTPPWPAPWVGGETGPVSREFKGLLAGALVVAGAVRVAGLGRGPARTAGAMAAFTACAGVALALGESVTLGGVPVGPGPWSWLRGLPPLHALRHTPRFNALVVLGGAVLVGLALPPLLGRLRTGWRSATVAGMLVLLPLEHWRPTGYGVPVPTGRDVPRVYRWLAETRPGPAADLPLYPLVARRYWASYLYFSTLHWMPVPIGRTSFPPPSQDLLAWTLLGFPDERSIGVLDRLGIKALVVHPRVWEEPLERREALASLERHPRLVLRREFPDDVPPRYADLQLGGERVYAIRPESPAAAPCQPAAEIDRRLWEFWTLAPDPPHRVRDDDPGTAWSTGREQRRGDALRVRLRSPQRVAAIVVETSPGGFPRRLVLEGKMDREEYHRLDYADGAAERWETLAGLLAGAPTARMTLRIPPQTLRAFRLVLEEPEDPAPPAWTVAELRAFRECR